MSPEAENIFEMPPHLFWGSCPFWAKLRMAVRQILFFFFCCNLLFLPLEHGSLVVIIWGDKANPIGSGSSSHTVLVAPASPASLLILDCVSAGCLFVLESLG